MEGKPEPDSAEAVERVLRSAREKVGSDHHRLPKFYLRGFAGKSGRIILADPEAGIRSVAPKNAFAESDYYTIRDEDLEPMALMEVLFEDFENHASRVHRFLVDGGHPADLDIEQRSYYAFLMAAQLTRGESFRDLDRRASEELMKQVIRLKAAHSEEWWSGLLEQMRADGEETPEISREAFVDFIERDEYEIRPAPEHTAEMMLSPMKDLAEIIIRFGWQVVRFDRPCLLTSEEPISFWRRPTEFNLVRGLGLATSDEVRMPLDPQTALVLTHPELGFPDRTGSGSQRAAGWMNFSTWAFRPSRPLVLCPDIERHPLPTPGDLYGDQLSGPLPPGPIIDR